MAIRAYQLLSEQKMLKGEDLDYRICHLDVMFSTQLIWRIENYRSLFNEAKMGKRLTVFSPPFYSFKNGYRMAASIALYGDGSGKAKHNSIFVTILRGEHDSLLHWPFACQVTFTMIDQKPSTEQRENVVVSLKPNITKENRPFLGRPSGERNPSFGIQKFVSLEDMKTKDFVKDDTCFVRVDLNIEDVPKI
uniref:MATH domain-containing protein n=1 Tax=Plectus sambesii TaxID=2011161 RepID=A0A914X918_9BILA